MPTPVRRKPTKTTPATTATTSGASDTTGSSPDGATSGADTGAATDGTATDSAATDGAATDGTATDSTATDGGALDAGAVNGDAVNPGDSVTGDAGDGCPNGCDDGNGCTDDSCVNGKCSHAVNTAPCDDGKACTTKDVCDSGTCAGAPLFWQKTFGGSGEDVGRAGAWLADGSVVVVGHSDGGGVASTGKGGRDAWVVRIDAHGELLWEQLLGNDLDQTAYDVAAWDGKFAVVGTWREHGDKRARGWLHVTDKAGKAVGSHVFGLGEVTELHAIAVGAAAAKPAIRMVAAGYLEDAAGDLALAVTRIDPTTLKPLWVKSHGTTGFDAAWDVVTLHNGHIAVVGDTAPGGSGPHVWLLELDDTGAVSWQRTYFSDGEDTGWSLVSDPDPVLQNKGYTVAGSRRKPGATSTAAWLMHADAAGKSTWQETATAPGGAAAYALARISGGFIAAGRSAKTAGNDEALLWRTDSAGATTWSLDAGVSGSAGYGAVVWNDAVGLVGKSGSGKAANLLVVRASLAGKTVCK